MKPAATEVTVQAVSPHRWDSSVELHKLSSGTGVLIVPAGADFYGFKVEEIIENRGLRRFPEPAPKFRMIFQPISRYSYNGYKGLGAFVQERLRDPKRVPGHEKVEAIVRPVRLSNMPVDCQFLAPIPNPKAGEEDEPSHIWRLCTALPVPSKVKAEKERQKAAYKHRRYMELPTRFDRI